MKNSEEELLKALGRAANDETETLPGIVTGMLQNQSRALQIMPTIMVVACLGLLVGAAVGFFRAVDLKASLFWATLFLAGLIILAILKIWYYLWWLRNSLMREIKRAELRLAARRPGE